jgi:ferredoxin
MAVIIGHDACDGAGQRVVPAPELFDHRDEEDTVMLQQLSPEKRGEAARRWPGPPIQLDES